MTKLPPLANFVSRRIKELAPIRSQKEIAAMAGFSSPNVISMLKTGTTKLALERVETLATALNCDPRVLMRLALEQFYEAPVVEQIIRCAEPKVSADEFQFVISLRNIIATAKLPFSFKGAHPFLPPPGMDALLSPNPAGELYWKS